MATACSLIQTLSTWHCSCQADMYRYTLLREIDVIGVCMERRRKRPSLAECIVFRNNSDSSTRLHRHPIAQCHPKEASSRKQHRNTNKKSNPKENYDDDLMLNYEEWTFNNTPHTNHTHTTHTIHTQHTQTTHTQHTLHTHTPLRPSSEIYS